MLRKLQCRRFAMLATAGIAAAAVALASAPERAHAQAELDGTFVDYLGVGANGIMINAANRSMRYAESGAAPFSCDTYFPGAATEEFALEATDLTGTFTGFNGVGTTNIVTTAGPTVVGRTITWQGLLVRLGAQLTVSQTFTLEMDGRVVTLDVTLANTGVVPLTNVFYLRNGDADFGQCDIGTSFETVNDVTRQPPTDASALVTMNTIAAATTPVVLAMGSWDSRARGHVATGLSNVAASATWTTPRDPNGTTQDVGVSMAFREPSLAVGARTSFRIYYVWGPNAATVTTRFDDLRCLTSPDGTSCTSGGVAGQCRASACCTGCWDGSACQRGNVVAACGSSGAACATCNDLNACSVDGCFAGACTTTPEPVGTACDDTLFCSTGDACNGAFACVGTARACGDALACTTDACDETVDMCTNAIDPASCVIGGACVASGDVDPASTCRTCAPAVSQSVYSPVAVGTGCDDGQFCTEGDSCDAVGACATGTARTCSDSLTCTADSCDETADACVNTIAAGSCAILGMCFADGDRNPADMLCSACVSATLATDFTFAPIAGCALVDAGVMPVDAGTGLDAGGMGTDAGTIDVDAGGTGVDAGGTGTDAGGTGVDAGGTGVDAGPTDVDSGAMTADAGGRDAGPEGGAATLDGGSSGIDGGATGRGGVTGGACSAAGGTAGGDASWMAWALMAGLAGLALRLRRRRSAAALVLLATVALGARETAHAQEGFVLNQYQAAPLATDGFIVSRPIDQGHLTLGAEVHLDYANDPLVYETDLGNPDSESRSIVEHQLVANTALSFGLFDRLVIHAQLPVTLVMDGDGGTMGIASADGASLGDLPVGIRARLFGEREDPFAIGLALGARIPLGDHAYSGDGGPVFEPRLLLEVRAGVRIGLDVGARIRETRNVQSLEIGHELTWRAGIAIPIVERRLEAHLEAFGATSFDDFGSREGTPIELIAGLKAHPIGQLVVGVAGGAGVTRGYGAPDARAIFMIGWADHRDPAPEPEPEPPPAVDDDPDRDGIRGSADRCPNEPEDPDQFQDEDGCPDPDNDDDGVLDVNDRAPLIPEDRDEFEDSDGAPDPDNDQDLILDADDRCRNEPEDRDQIQDEDGCPETDADADQVLDPEDHCPLTPGVRNEARAECNGCPALACQTAEGTIIILERVEFATNSDVVLERSQPVLDAVLQILQTNPQIRRLRVEGHTDDRGRDAANMDLSNRRAASVMRNLVEHGVAAERLESQGFGETRPLAPNRSRRARQNNRRVEFHITDPAPPAAAPDPAGPVPAPTSAP